MRNSKLRTQWTTHFGYQLVKQDCADIFSHPF